MTTEVLGGDPARELPDPARLGPYRLVQQLGEGGMGVVHLALDVRGRAVAIKVLRPHIAHDPVARQRLAREVETLSRIDDPRVAPVLDADLDGDRPYLVTRYVAGTPLDDVVRESGPLEGEDLLRVGRGLAEALDAIHEADVIHRDLKPGNVLLVDGEPVLIDFGIAHIADDVRITMTGLVMGTPGYLAPEVIEGAPVTEATDWWGWASTLAFAASGAPPFGRGPMDAVLARVATGEADLSGVDPSLAPLLYAALSPDPGMRPGADVVLAGLERYASGGDVTEVLPAGRRRAASTEPLSPRRTARLAPVLAPAPAPKPRIPAPAPLVEPTPAPIPPPVGAAPPSRYAGEFDDDYDFDDEVSEVDQALGGQGDPRIGLPSRGGTLLALLLLLVALAACFPAVFAVVVLLWQVVARTTDRSVTSLVMRRHDRGYRRSDVPVSVLATPWHLGMAVVASLIVLLLPVLVSISAVFCTALAMVAVNGGSPQPNSSIPIATGATIATLIGWWGPGGASLRRGTRTVVRGVSHGPRAQQVVVILALIAAAVLVAWASSNGPVPSWWPGSGAPVFWTGGFSIGR